MTQEKSAVDATEAKLERLHGQLADAMSNLVTGDAWARALEFAARFRSRSFNKTILICMQHVAAFEQGRVPEPTPTYVDGFRQWLALGRSVDRGQTGYMIFAPVLALMIGAAHGLDTSGYTVPYVSTWAASVAGKTPVEVIQATGERVRSAAVAILRSLSTTQVGSGEPPGLTRGARPSSLRSGVDSPMKRLDDARFVTDWRSASRSKNSSREL